jgi:hypothetical protein
MHPPSSYFTTKCKRPSNPSTKYNASTIFFRSIFKMATVVTHQHPPSSSGKLKFKMDALATDKQTP